MKEDLMFCHLGNGISVCDKNREVNNDYVNVAHISVDRVVSYRKRKLSPEAKEEIERYAREENPQISATQNQPVFNTVGKRSLKTLRTMVNAYLTLHKNEGGTTEFDKRINDYSRQTIEAMKAEKGQAWLLKINRYKDETEKPYLVEYTGQDIYNFEYTAVIPVNDSEIIEMLKYYETLKFGDGIMTYIEKITKRIYDLGGVNLFWC